VKETARKRQYTMRKSFVSYSYDRGLKSRTYKGSKKLNTKITNNLIKNKKNELKRCFSNEIYVINAFMKNVQHFSHQ
jgi:hypothetical protein